MAWRQMTGRPFPFGHTTRTRLLYFVPETGQADVSVRFFFRMKGTSQIVPPIHRAAHCKPATSTTQWWYGNRSVMVMVSRHDQQLSMRNEQFLEACVCRGYVLLRYAFFDLTAPAGRLLHPTAPVTERNEERLWSTG